MGCFHSKGASFDDLQASQHDGGKGNGTANGAGAGKGGEQGQRHAGGAQPSYLRDAAPGSILLGGGGPGGAGAAGGAGAGAANSQPVAIGHGSAASLANSKFATPNSPRGSVGDPARSSALSVNGGGGASFILGAGSGSISARRTPMGKNGAHVSADLNAIVDDQGTINALVSRQLSIMSHYSVKSEAGSVILQPEVGTGTNALGFTLHKLIGRGGFGNVYLGDWEGRRVAVKVVSGNNEASDQVRGHLGGGGGGGRAGQHHMTGGPRGGGMPCALPGEVGLRCTHMQQVCNVHHASLLAGKRWEVAEQPLHTDERSPEHGMAWRRQPACPRYPSSLERHHHAWLPPSLAPPPGGALVRVRCGVCVCARNTA